MALNDAPLVTAASIADGSITTPKLANGAVTNAKLGLLAVGQANIDDGAVSTNKIDDGAVTIGKLDPSIAVDIYAPDRTTLSLLPVGSLPDLLIARVYTAGLKALSFFILEKSSTLAIDGINVLSATVGRWIRLIVGLYEFQTQTVWYVDPAAGNNENDGLTPGTAIRDDKEWCARTDGEFCSDVGINCTMRLVGAVWPHRFNYAVRQRGPGSFNQFFVIGQQAVVRAGSCTAPSTQPNQTTEYATITDAAVVSWAANVGQLVVAANGASGWVMADLGGGAARISGWLSPGGGSMPAPPAGTTYNVVTVTQIGVNTSPNSPLNTLYFQDIQLVTGLRSMSPLMGFLRCKVTAAQVGGAGAVLLTNCLINTGTWRLSDDQFNAAITNACVYLAGCGVLNTVVTISHGYLELLDCCFQGSRLALTDLEVNNVHSGTIGNATLTMTGTYGTGFFLAPAGNPLLLADKRATVYNNEPLFGAGNLGTGVQLGHNSAFFMKNAGSVVVATAGAQLVLPANPIPTLVPGLVVPLSAACATFAAVAAAPFNGEVWTCTEWCTVKVG
jgi:hypothetical protein